MKLWLERKREIEAKITAYLQAAPLDKLIQQKSLSEKGVFANLCKWMENEDIDRLSPNAKRGILDAIKTDTRWADIAEVFYTDIEFGTGGIRGRAVIQDDELEMLRDEGIQASFLRGPNTINDLVIAHISSAIAMFGRDRRFNSIVIGYDSRIRGKDFAHLVASVFVAYGFKIYLFDDVVPYPELTFAIPHLHADMGILISASHNDRRYNGYKLSCANGSQFSIQDRAIILNEYIAKTGYDIIDFFPLESVNSDRLVFLGGGLRYPHLTYYKFQRDPVDMHFNHFSHVLDFVLDRESIRYFGDRIHVAYSAYNGAGGPTVKRLIDALGVIKFDVIASMYKVDGMFPAFEDLRSPKGYKVYQQPDPGEPRAAETALRKYIEEYGSDRAKHLDVLIGTDPDADRTGLTVKVPPDHKPIYNGSDYILLDADIAWSLILWYRLKHWEKITGLKKLNLDLENCFLAQSHTTTDIMPLLARKYGLGWVKTWVGFAQLAAGTEKVWKGVLQEDYFATPNRTEDFRSIYKYENISSKSIYNFAALEQSNGFSILGGRPKSEYDLGEYGHVRDKDGTFAAILFFDILAYAKKQGMHVLELVDQHLYLDETIGLIRTGYRAAPQYGQYEGLVGRSLKLDVLKRSLDLTTRISKRVTIGRRKVTGAEIYKTGKYDIQHGHTQETGFDLSRRETYWFPDEGIRFYFENQFNHLTIRPSGTSQSLRFHIQLRNPNVDKSNLRKEHKKLEEEIQLMFEDIGAKVGVDWEI
ncbi:MAG: hypothetical protein HY033_06965 [Ignavibacteriae bacterium]|nr:hypothetical protein [Ignavibacteria bacterium]MBI3364633.1 hypothetical protein [Ignavibacteriota bacterium]